jgi:hypothetical protein
MRDETVRKLAPWRSFFAALAPASLLEKPRADGVIDAGPICALGGWANVRLAT